MVLIEEHELSCEKSLIAQLARISDVQKQFKNCFLVVIGLESDEVWESFQMLVDDSIRLFRCIDLSVAVSTINQYRLYMSNNEKAKLQTTYFALEKEKLTAPATARAMTKQAFDRMGIPTSDTQIIMEGYPSLAHILTATREAMEENSPADSRSIECITSFFAGDTPKLQLGNKH